MIDTKKIDKKLEHAGIYTANANNYELLKRTVHLLIRASSEQGDYIVNKLCEVNPFIAAECIIGSNRSNTYKKQIIDAVKESDIPDIFKIVIFYRYDETSEFEKVSLQSSNKYFDTEKIFKSWNDFCKFVCWVIRTQTKIDWLYDLINNKNISISTLYQNRIETKQMMDALLSKRRFDCLNIIYKKIRIENYYIFSEHKYEEIQRMFAQDISSCKDQIVYCFTDSRKRGENLFGYFHAKNTFLKDDPVARMVALLYEYIATNDYDEAFIKRVNILKSTEIHIHNLSGNKMWRKSIAEVLIQCVKNCIINKRNFATLKEMMEPVNFFSFNNSTATGLDVINAEDIKIDEIETKNLFSEYVKDIKNTDVLDVYLNSYLKLVISFDDAIRIVYENVPEDIFKAYLDNAVFPAKISHKDSEKLIIHLRNLSSRAYTPKRDSILCEDINKNERIFARFQFDDEIGLVVSCIGKDAENLKNIRNYSELTQEQIKDIKAIASGTINEEIFKHLSLCSEVPMGYIKQSFRDLLTNLCHIKDVNAFTRTIKELSWNKKYHYEAGRVYESTDVMFFSLYRNDALTVLKNISAAGLSENNLVSVYMNSFFKLTNTIKDLMFINSINTRANWKEYVFVGKNQNGNMKLVSVKNIYGAVFEYPTTAKFKKLDSYIYRIKRFDARSIEFEFCEDETKKYVLPNKINRMLRAYNTISTNTSVNGYEYEHIKKVSSDFYRDDNVVCRRVSEYTIKGTQIRHTNYQSIYSMITNLGDANIYGENFFPILMYTKISHFSRERQSEYDKAKYVEAKQLCKSFIRNSKTISQALFLYINTYVKGRVSFIEFFKMCNDISTLNKNPCELYMNAVAIIHIQKQRLIFTFVDISIPGIDVSQISQYRDRINNGGRYYVRIKIQFDGDFKTTVCTIWNIEKTEKYSID